MKHQLSIAREGIEAAIASGVFIDKPVRRALLDALTALSELERMVGEPVAWPTLPIASGVMAYMEHPYGAMRVSKEPAYTARQMQDYACEAVNKLKTSADNPVGEVMQLWNTEKECNDGVIGNLFVDLPVGTNLYTATPAQKPQYEAGDMASAHNDGFRAGVASVTQQPQAEAFGYVSQHTNGSWEFSPTAAGVYPDTAKSITAVYTKQPQAEVVPPDVVRDAERYRWLASVCESDGSGYWLTEMCVKEGEIPPCKQDVDASIDAAIAQQKGGVA